MFCSLCIFKVRTIKILYILSVFRMSSLAGFLLPVVFPDKSAWWEPQCDSGNNFVLLTTILRSRDGTGWCSGNRFRTVTFLTKVGVLSTITLSELLESPLGTGVPTNEHKWTSPSAPATKKHNWMHTDINDWLKCLELSSVEFMEVINYDQFISVQTEYMWKAHIKSITEDEGLEVTETSRTYYCENWT